MAAADPSTAVDSDVVPLIREKLLRWGLFGVCFAVLPIAFNAISAATRNGGFSLESLLSNGELLLISAAVSAASAGELFGREEVLMRSTRLFLVGMSFIIVCGSSLWFADIAGATRDQADINEHFIAVGSIIIFFFSAVTGACCVILSELKK